MAQLFDLPLDQLKVYTPFLTREDDFNNFWDVSLKELAGVPLEYELTPYKYPAKNVQVYNVRFKGFDFSQIEAWLAIPVQVEPCPAIALFHGYNWAFDGGLHDIVNFSLHGYAVIGMLVRGQQGASVDSVISSHGFTCGWMTKGICNPFEYYYRAVYMDAVRTVQVLSNLTNVDKNKIAVLGGSQGGGIALATAALSDIPSLALVEMPFLAHFERAIDTALNGPYLELQEFFRRNSNPTIEKKAKKTLSYIDLINLAPNITCPTYICTGLVDEITPPSTVFAVYNHLTCLKDIDVFRYFGHEYMPGWQEKKLRTLLNWASQK